MTRRLLVTGAGGFVGGNIIREADSQLPADWEIHAISGKPAPIPLHEGRHVWHQASLGEAASGFQAVRSLIAELKPESIIHSAAIADIDYCARHHEEARATNVELTRAVVESCASSGARMVHLSTDTIFDGKRGNYREDDLPGAVNFYGETKIEAEAIVRTLGDRASIGRVCLVMGLPVGPAGNSFLVKMLAALEAGKPSAVPTDEIRTPVDVISLARVLLELARRPDRPGCFHLAGNDCLVRFEMARRIARHLGFSESLIEPAKPSTSPDRAPRPRDVSLDNSKWRSMLTTPTQNLESGLDLVMTARL